MKHDDYSQYNPEVHRPFSPHLSVEQGEKQKGRANPKTIVQMTAMPGFIQRMKPQRVGAHKNKNVDGIIEDSFQELADESDDHLDGIDRHLGQLLADGDEATWALLDD